MCIGRRSFSSAVPFPAAKRAGAVLGTVLTGTVVLYGGYRYAALATNQQEEWKILPVVDAASIPSQPSVRIRYDSISCDHLV